MTSQIKTALLLTLLTGIIMLLGAAAGGRTGLFIALGIALVLNFFSYWYSDRIVLAMYKAEALSPEDAPALHQIIEELAERAGIPKPRLVLIPQDSPNAFATGRNPSKAVVAVTRGILKLMPPEELRGVLAHEMGHVKNRDILIQTVAAVMATAIMFLGNMLRFAAIFGGRSNDGEGGNPLGAIILAILAPIAAVLIQMAISRSREYLADATGARLAGDPVPLAKALQRLDSAARQLPMRGNPATENMFIVNPFSGRGLGSLFATHPPIEDRVRRLLAMAKNG